MHNKTVIIVSTLDTKPEETRYLREQLEKKGCKTIIVDVGTKGSAAISADISREEILAAAGVADPAQLERPKLMNAMIKGAGLKVNELLQNGKLDGIISIGGATGSLMGTGVMKALPFGVPKMMVSSVAAARGLVSRYFGTADISIMHSVVDFTGLNDLMRDVLARAAGSIVGMIEAKEAGVALDTGKKQEQRMVAMTLLNMCEKSASYVRQQLEQEGYQVIGFSATGVPDMAMEDMIEKERIFCGIIDLAPGAVGEELLGGTRAAGPHRLEAAGNVGITQIIAPCLVNLMTPPKSKYKPEYYQRQRYDLDALRSYLRLSPEELVVVAEAFARKLNQAKGPVKVIMPTKGWSGIDGEGTVLYNPEEDRIFITELRKLLRSDIEVREVEANLEDPEFAEEILKAFREAMKAG
ncbi:MAG: Tm-1-like ATP-binding domain-containing protein [Desulfotomaculaceae bacterium]|nr:Tm-1-like ATP-binding domain-containing protein [Desulfotomaculaceae bacterium]